jgi:hypothetical protein
MPVIQFTKISGVIIEKARWVVNTLENVGVGHYIQFNFNIDEDPSLVSYISKRSNIDCVVEKNDEGQYSVILTGVVKAFRHMVDASKLESMITVIPANRAIENVLLYILDKNQCDPKFTALLKQTN